MKRYQLIILLLSLPTVLLNSCIFMGPAIRGEGEVKQQTRNITNFGEVEVSRGLEVFLIPDTLEYVVVEADENLHDVILTELKGKTLDIYTDKFIRSAKSRKIHVHFIHLSAVSSTSGSIIRSENTIQSKRLYISASSGSRQTLDVNAGEFEGSCSSGAHIELSGKARKATLRASSGAHLKGDDFSAEVCEAKASSGAHIRTGVRQEFIAEASSGGHIYYSGDPESTSFDSSSGGSIEKQ